MTSLSVVIPVYNTEKYLARCLDSVLDQDLDPREVEILVIDDGSTDSSLEIAQEYAERHPQITVRTQENTGAAVLRNVAMRGARGRYLFFLDSDDYIAPQSLGSLVRAACALDVDVLALDHKRVTEDEAGPVPRLTVPTDLRVRRGVDYIADHRYLSEATAYLWGRDHLERVGAQFDEGRIVEDIVFTATVVAAAQRLVRVPGDFYYYVQRPGSIMNTTDDAHTLKLVADYERVVVRLEELRQSWLARGVPSGFDRRLRVRQQTFVFFLIARVVRSGLPSRQVLPPVLAKFRTIGMYPMTSFPGGEFPQPHYRVLTAVFNRPYLLWPFATATSIAAHLAETIGV